MAKKEERKEGLEKEKEKVSKKITNASGDKLTRKLRRKNDLETRIKELKKEIDKTIEFLGRSTQELDRHYSPKITAKDIFFWYDTKGFPLELIRFCLENKQHKFPEKEFNVLLEKQKEKSQKDRERKKVSVF